MNDNDKSIMKDVSVRLAQIAFELENLSDEARKELEESKNFDVADEIEHIESLSADILAVID